MDSCAHFWIVHRLPVSRPFPGLILGRIVHKVAGSAILAVLISLSAWSAAPELSEDAVNSASIADWSNGQKSQPDPFIIRVQVLLDRANISPGVIDGYLGDNLTKAIRAFEVRETLDADGKIDEKFWTALSADGAPVLETYEISAEDLSQRYVEKIPEDYAEMAAMKWLGHTGPKECLPSAFTWMRACSNS